jgi:hypothetical protein
MFEYNTVYIQNDEEEEVYQTANMTPAKDMEYLLGEYKAKTTTHTLRIPDTG